MKSNDKIRILL